MITFCVFSILLIATGIFSYLASARFGLRASNLDRRPMHYAHLRKRLKPKPKPQSELELLLEEHRSRY